MGHGLRGLAGPLAKEPIANAKRHLAAAYLDVRRATERLCAPLAIEDHVPQAMTDVSPPRWHLAHVSWFFETFLLKPHLPGYQPVDPRYEYLFNSYYNSVGPPFPRARRGHLSRPTVAEVYAYRAHVDQGMLSLLGDLDDEKLATLMPVLFLGLNHEQQHQELLLTDIKYNFWVNPLRPRYHHVLLPRVPSPPSLRWVDFEGGVVSIGQPPQLAAADGLPDGLGGVAFAFDNETPRHQALLQPFRLASRPVTNGELLEFIEAGGYRRSELWLSLGWEKVQEGGWEAPLYWERIDGAWWAFTLSGMLPLDQHAPAAHVSYLEADAFARWKGYRLPTEQEWEHAAAGSEIEGNLLQSGLYHPVPPPPSPAAPLRQLYGDVWEWTRSPYVPYPGFAPQAGALGEYNGKFMVGQMVLRGGSCATPRGHIRATYRNFFPPEARWQFAGIRLAADT